MTGKGHIGYMHYTNMEGIDAGRSEKARVMIGWVPGHNGNAGNERADEEAKKGARGDSTDETYRSYAEGRSQ